MIPLATVTMDVSSNSSLPNVSSSFLYTFYVLLFQYLLHKCESVMELCCRVRPSSEECLKAGILILLYVNF